jgi:hypothetical protein
MRCRHDVVLIVLSLGLLLLVGVTFLLAVLGLLPGDVLAFELLGAMVVYGVPLAIILALCAAIIYFSDRRSWRASDGLLASITWPTKASLGHLTQGIRTRTSPRSRHVPFHDPRRAVVDGGGLGVASKSNATPGCELRYCLSLRWPNT